MRYRLTGFTLIELLVVISIISILLSIVAPALRKVRECGRRMVCGTNLNSFGLALGLYHQENNRLPWEGHADGDKPSNPVGPWAEPSFWPNALMPFINERPYCQEQKNDTVPGRGDHSTFVCPSAGTVLGGPGDTIVDGYYMMWGGKDGTTLSHYLGPSNQEQRKVYWCYVWNSKLNNSADNTPNLLGFRTPLATIPVLVEKMMRVDEVNPIYPDTLGRSKTANTRFAARHSGGGQLLFLDGHVDFYTREYVNETDEMGYFSKPGQIMWDPFGKY
jgi:prepilin-type N-terminal cleavage/methylation domain-containing protein/prepilin-type processing-associated H-X9-DG protein